MAERVDMRTDMHCHLDTLDIRAGDLVMVSGTSDVVRVSSVTASIINLETAMVTAAISTDSVQRIGALVGATQDGIDFLSKITIVERECDQVLDTISAKGDKRVSGLRFGAIEFTPRNIQAGGALPASAVTKTGTKTVIGAGATSSVLPTERILVIGRAEDGRLTTLLIPKAVQQGDVGVSWSKKGNAKMGMDFKLLHDDTMAAGFELYRLEFDTAHNFALIA